MSKQLFRFTRLTNFLILSVLFLFQSSVKAQDSTERSSGMIGSGQGWTTPWYKVDSGVPGPTIMVFGGVHGNEPAGYRAAQQIRHWPICKGKLIVVPRVNKLGIAANIRWMPKHRNDKKTRDLNRNFPIPGRDEAQTQLAKAVWDFTVKQKPDWVFDLHEGFDYHLLNSKSVGSSVIALPAEKKLAAAMVDSVNGTIDSKRKFVLLARNGPVIGSLARACAEKLGSKSFILETTTKLQSISVRTRQHRRMLATAFERMGVINSDAVNLMTPRSKGNRTRVAVFDGPGAGCGKVVAALDSHPRFIVRHVSRKEMKEEVLEQFDVILFPGGSAGKQSKSIGKSGREAVRRFVKRGGGYVGICAGAYLCTSHYDWSLNLMNASVLNRMVDIPGKGKKSLWYRGPATNVQVEINSKGAKITGIDGLHTIRYENGPILSPGNKKDVPSYGVLALFRSENGIYAAQKDTMVNTPAVVASRYGKGRVVAISPHFESTQGKQAVIANVVDFVSK